MNGWARNHRAKDPVVMVVTPLSLGRRLSDARSWVARTISTHHRVTHEAAAQINILERITSISPGALDRHVEGGDATGAGPALCSRRAPMTVATGGQLLHAGTASQVALGSVNAMIRHTRGIDG
jgi:hypothetical protein